VAVTTPTASGKTLCFNLPVFQSILENPKSRALYLYPMKALAQDQLKTLQEWMGRMKSAKLPVFSAEIYDGDTATGVRAKIRKNPPNILLSNPDMLHLGILAFHDGWAEFFKNLKYVVIDEAHSYRGIFGSHVAHVLRRLRRICRFYGSDPKFITCSATLGNPEEFLGSLTGLNFEIISETGAPQNEKTFVLWNPDTASPYTEAVTLLIEALKAGMKTIVFTKARKITELISLWVTQARPEWASQIKSYRAGYLPEERREIEAKLFKDELKAVISTSALEVGIDVGGLDACILVGYPGTMISTWQRSGRVGRGEAPSVVFLVAMADAMDQFWMKHPNKFFTMKPESLMVGFENENIAKAHLRCAASELPLTASDKVFYGKLLEQLLPGLIQDGGVLESASGDKWLVTDKNPQRGISIRDMGEGYQIITQETGELIGTIDGHRAFRDCHPGAVYLHQGVQYVVKEFQWEQHKILVSDEPVDYYTQVNYEEETEILEELKRRPLGDVKSQSHIRWGRVKITQRFINYEIHRIADRSLVATYPLTLPPLMFETRSLWMILPDYLQRNLADRDKKIHFMGGLHAAEHGTIAMMPLHVVCDRWDLGGISTPAHPQVPQPVIFIYDGYPGGVGLSERAYETMEELLTTTFEMIRDCECEEGCPSCVQSPKCGSGNHPLDKQGALLILGHILGRTDFKPLRSSGLPREALVKAEPALPAVEAPVPILPVPTPAAAPKISQDPPPTRTGPVVFDIETQFLAGEIQGGWSNLIGMKLSCAVLYDVNQDKYYTYVEDNVDDLIRHLQASTRVIGFNTLRFDYGVLQGYTSFKLQSLPSLDLMADLQKKLNHRLSLAHLAQHTLGGAEKSADGLLAVKWWREGKYQMVIDYCRQDVKLTYDLWKFGKEKGYVLFKHKQSGEIVKCPVNW
jgi:DEAD/DEAH box helicase domain-containing protein